MTPTPTPSPTPTPKPTTPTVPAGPKAGDVLFTLVQYDPAGKDTNTTKSLNSEYWRITNKTTKTINMRYWTVGTGPATRTGSRPSICWPAGA